MKVDFKHIILVVSMLFLGRTSTFAQWDTTYQQTYGGNRDDVAMDVITTPDNGFLIIGSTSSFGFDNSQMYFLKLDSIGNIMWSKSHGGTGQEHGTSLIQTSDGGYVGVGYTNSWGEGGFDVFLVKLDANGNLEYEAVKGGFDWDFAWDVIEPTPGKYLIAAETQSFGNGNSDGWLLQFDNATQSWDWETTIGTSSTENLKAVTKGNNNDFFAVGMGHANTPNDSDIMVVRFNTLGDSLDTYFYGDTLLDFGNAITLMQEGTIAITGTREINGTPPSIAVLKIDSLGIIEFDTNWSSNFFIFGEGRVIFEIPNSQICIGGTVTKYSGNDDFYLAYSYPGNKNYNKGNTHGSNFIEAGSSAVYLGNDGFLIVGTTDGYGTSFKKVLTVKTDSLVLLDSPNDFKFNEDSINITGINPLPVPENNITYNTFNNTIKLENGAYAQLVIMDITGKLLIQKQFNNIISLQSLNIKPGIYFAHIITKEGHWSTLIILN